MHAAAETHPGSIRGDKEKKRQTLIDSDDDDDDDGGDDDNDEEILVDNELLPTHREPYWETGLACVPSRVGNWGRFFFSSPPPILTGETGNTCSPAY